jgi:hypothetical protein
MEKQSVTNYEDKHEFIPVYCKCYRPNPKFLGYFQIDVVHVSKYYCKDCKTMHTYLIDEFGVIVKSRSVGEKPIEKPSEELLTVEA